MAHDYIEWTKVYDVHHREGNFNLYIASHKTGWFFGTILYYAKVDDKIPGQTSMTIPTFEFRQYNIPYFQTEEEIYNQATKWIDENLKGKYTISLRETKHFNDI